MMDGGASIAKHLYRMTTQPMKKPTTQEAEGVGIL